MLEIWSRDLFWNLELETIRFVHRNQPHPGCKPILIHYSSTSARHFKHFSKEKSDWLIIHEETRRREESATAPNSTPSLELDEARRRRAAGTCMLTRGEIGLGRAKKGEPRVPSHVQDRYRPGAGRSPRDRYGPGQVTAGKPEPERVMPVNPDSEWPIGSREDEGDGSMTLVQSLSRAPPGRV